MYRLLKPFQLEGKIFDIGSEIDLLEDDASYFIKTKIMEKIEEKEIINEKKHKKGEK